MSIPPPLSPQKTSGLAITSLVLGILSFICCGLVSGVPALICGHIARGKIKRDPSLSGDGLALAGLILGYLSIFTTLFMSALALPAITGAVVRGEMTQTLSQAKQIHLAVSQMALDGRTTDNKSLGFPADAGIRSVADLKERLINERYLTAEDIERLEFDKFLIGNVSSVDPSETILIRSKPATYPDGSVVYMRLGGDGRLLTKRQIDQMDAQDPPRQPAYLPEN